MRKQLFSRKPFFNPLTGTGCCMCGGNECLISCAFHNFNTISMEIISYLTLLIAEIQTLGARILTTQEFKGCPRTMIKIRARTSSISWTDNWSLYKKICDILLASAKIPQSWVVSHSRVHKWQILRRKHSLDLINLVPTSCSF